MSKNKLSDEDLALFRSAMKGVTPLKTSEKIDSFKQDKIVSTKKRLNPVPILKATAHPYLSDYIHEPIFSESIITYQSPDLPTKQMRALKRADIPIQAKLDLHGLYPDDAREALLSFIHHQHHVGHRCVIIIHGKGGQQGETPVLKNLVIHWLKQIDLILGFHSAPLRHGGAGAVLVLLRRNSR